jgi:hypothetical protein
MINAKEIFYNFENLTRLGFVRATVHCTDEGSTVPVDLIGFFTPIPIGYLELDVGQELLPIYFSSTSLGESRSCLLRHSVAQIVGMCPLQP